MKKHTKRHFFSLQRKISFNDLDIHVWNPQMKDTPVCSFIRTTFSENLGFLTEPPPPQQGWWGGGGGQPILSPWCFQLFFYSLLRQPLPPLTSEYLKNSQQNLFMIGVSVLKGSSANLAGICWCALHFTYSDVANVYRCAREAGDCQRWCGVRSFRLCCQPQWWAFVLHQWRNDSATQGWRDGEGMVVGKEDRHQRWLHPKEPAWGEH